jgi:hypothetical protein
MTDLNLIPLAPTEHPGALISGHTAAQASVAQFVERLRGDRLRTGVILRINNRPAAGDRDRRPEDVP